MNKYLLVKIFMLSLLFAAPPAYAFMVETENFDTTQYGAFPSTRNVVYVSRCERSKFTPYEWKIWEGYYSIRAYILPVATISVVKDSSDTLTMDISSFTAKAVQKAASVGGNIVCLIQIKKDKFDIGLGAITFRAYRQFFESGNPNLVKYYNDIVNKGLPLTLREVNTTEEQSQPPPVQKK